MPDTEQTEHDKASEEDLENYQYCRGKNWTEENIRTLTTWLHTSAIMLDLTREANTHYRKVMRRSTIINLIFSSIAGTVSLSQFNITEAAYNILDILLKAFFSVSSILVALNTGYIKVYQIQERLEKTIQLQQQWSNFGSLITSELQLPTQLRKDALQVINKMKETYHQLIRDHVDINRDIIEKVAIRNGISPQQLTISDLFERVIMQELSRIRFESENSMLNILKDDDADSVSSDYTTSPLPPPPPSQSTSTSRRTSQLKSLQRSSTHLFENVNRKKLRTLDKKVMNTRTQIANMVLSPPPRQKQFNAVMNELKQKKGLKVTVEQHSSSDDDDNDSVIQLVVDPPVRQTHLDKEQV